jgi:hypothetical protein
MAFPTLKNFIIVLLIACTAFVPFSVANAQRFGQKPDRPQGRQQAFGGKLGLVVSNIYGSDSEGSIARFAAGFGGFFVYGTRNIAFQTELRYAPRGFGIDLGSETATMALNYVEIPLLFKFINPIAQNEDGAIRMFYLGPIIAFKTGSSLSAAGIGIDVNNTKSVVFDLSVGADAFWYVGSNYRIYIDLNFTIGLTNPFDDADPLQVGNFVLPDGQALDLKPIGFGFYLGLGF